MGYYTFHTVEALNVTAEQGKRIESVMRNMGILSSACLCDGYQIAGNYYFDCEDMSKWYDCTEDMTQLSKTFPEVHFVVSGDGEDSGDFWQEHFLGGKHQVCTGEIVYPPFDPNLLEE